MLPYFQTPTWTRRITYLQSEFDEERDPPIYRFLWVRDGVRDLQIEAEQVEEWLDELGWRDFDLAVLAGYGVTVHGWTLVRTIGEGAIFRRAGETVLIKWNALASLASQQDREMAAVYYDLLRVALDNWSHLYRLVNRQLRRQWHLEFHRHQWHPHQPPKSLVEKSWREAGLMD